MPFHSKIALLWLFNVAGNNKTFCGLLVKDPIFLPGFNEICIFSIIFHKTPQNRISHKSVQWEPCWYVRPVGQTDGLANSLIPFQAKRALLWRLNVVGNSKRYFGLLVKCPIFLSDFNQIWIFSTEFQLSPEYKSSWNSAKWESCWYMQTDGRTGLQTCRRT
jgi:hypothetical protein